MWTMHSTWFYHSPRLQSEIIVRSILNMWIAAATSFFIVFFSFGGFHGMFFFCPNMVVEWMLNAIRESFLSFFLSFGTHPLFSAVEYFPLRLNHSLRDYRSPRWEVGNIWIEIKNPLTQLSAPPTQTDQKLMKFLKLTRNFDKNICATIGTRCPTVNH